MDIEFGIIRNAGGRAADAVRSLVVLDALIPIGTVMVIHHTGKRFYCLFVCVWMRADDWCKDCGTTHVLDDEVRRVVKARSPEMAGAVEGMVFGEIVE
jgi:carbonic anhydrase